MESHQDSHDKRVSEWFYPAALSITLYHRQFQNEAKLRALTFGWLFNRGKGNRKTGGGGRDHLIVVASYRGSICSHFLVCCYVEFYLLTEKKITNIKI